MPKTSFRKNSGTIDFFHYPGFLRLFYCKALLTQGLPPILGLYRRTFPVIVDQVWVGCLLHSALYKLYQSPLEFERSFYKKVG
jgi:hypothetical protein